MTADEEVSALLAKGRVREAVARTIATYGPELLGYLVALERHEQEAHEIFSTLCEDVVKGLAGFEGRASLRTWLYQVARNARSRHYRREAPELVPISRFASELAADVRTATAPHLKTTMKSQYRRLRERLEPQDQEMLILRIDRGLSWQEVARVLGGDEGVGRRAAALRKRFERVKVQLAGFAEEAGILPARVTNSSG